MMDATGPNPNNAQRPGSTHGERQPIGAAAANLAALREIRS
jgi:hypothetical protein